MLWWRTTSGFDRLRFLFSLSFFPQDGKFLFLFFSEYILKKLSPPRPHEKKQAGKLGDAFRQPKKYRIVFRFWPFPPPLVEKALLGFSAGFFPQDGKTNGFQDKNDDRLFFIFQEER
jgi:hypothetical protein